MLNYKMFFIGVSLRDIATQPNGVDLPLPIRRALKGWRVVSHSIQVAKDGWFVSILAEQEQ